MRRPLLRIMPDGSVRGVWDGSDALYRGMGCKPVRAGRISVVEEGPFADLFAVEILIGQHSEDPSQLLCLWPPLASYEACHQAEIAWLTENWVKAKTVFEQETT